MSSQRSKRLDFLRAIAVLLVLCRHYSYFASLQAIGWVGVDLFFVLSGFLISGLLFSEVKTTGRIDVRRFLIRRGFKIYPAFYVFLAITVLVEWFVFDRHILRSQLFGETFFLQNYVQSFWGHTWSLAVEEHFYLFLPAALVFLLWWRPDPAPIFRGLPALILTLNVLILVVRSWTTARGVPDILYKTHLRADALAAGVLLSWCWHFRHAELRRIVGRWRWWIGLAVPVLVAPAWLGPDAEFVTSVGLTMIYLGMAGLLALVLCAPWVPAAARVLLTPIARLGAFSYSIYLWHVPLRNYVQAMGFSVSALGFASYIAVSVLVGVGMSKLVEMNALELRDRLFPAKRGALK